MKNLIQGSYYLHIYLYYVSFVARKTVRREILEHSNLRAKKRHYRRYNTNKSLDSFVVAQGSMLIENLFLDYRPFFMKIWYNQPHAAENIGIKRF